MKKRCHIIEDRTFSKGKKAQQLYFSERTISQTFLSLHRSEKLTVFSRFFYWVVERPIRRNNSWNYEACISKITYIFIQPNHSNLRGKEMTNAILKISTSKNLYGIIHCICMLIPRQLKKSDNNDGKPDISIWILLCKYTMWSVINTFIPVSYVSMSIVTYSVSQHTRILDSCYRWCAAFTDFATNYIHTSSPQEVTVFHMAYPPC